MKEQSELRHAGGTASAGQHARTGIIDLLAFLAVLAFVCVLMIIHVRLAYAGIAGLAIGCVTVWGRLRKPARRRWLSGQFMYRGRKFSIVSAWGVEGQAPPAVEPSSPPGLPASPGDTQS